MSSITTGPNMHVLASQTKDFQSTFASTYGASLSRILLLRQLNKEHEKTTDDTRNVFELQLMKPTPLPGSPLPMTAKD